MFLKCIDKCREGLGDNLRLVQCLPCPFIGVQAIMCGLIDVADAGVVSPLTLTCLLCIFRTALPLESEREKEKRTFSAC